MTYLITGGTGFLGRALARALVARGDRVTVLSRDAVGARRHFPGVPVITTAAALKREHCHPGDVLVDDRDQHRRLWEQAGGLFIHHRSAKASIAALKAAGYI